MHIPYLRDLPWTAWSREERYFCAVLFQHAAADPAGFADWVIGTTGIPVPVAGDWDVGYEVCFYRDYLWQQGQSARDRGLPAKRTFDLCLFGERDIVVIEAKVCEAFDALQNEDFAKDVARINGLGGLEGVGVHVIALASTAYFANAEQHGRPQTLSMFEGRITWADAALKYPDARLEQADRMYGMKPGASLGV